MAINEYGDERKLTKGGFGVDVASQRADDLDQLALARITASSQRLRALDLACGEGGQAVRMALAGAESVASDVQDNCAAVAALAGAADVQVAFVQADMRCLDTVDSLRTPFDIIVCQRAIHYLPFKEALEALKQITARLAPGGRLYLSASGLHSELGNDYPGANVPLESRYAPLSLPMQEKHGIRGPVCLYTPADMDKLLGLARLKPERLFTSQFGNVKSEVARPG